MNKAIILLSGGLDSTTVLYMAKEKGFRCYALIFDYGQRHVKEIKNAVKIAQTARCSYEVAKISLPWLGSSLLDKTKKIPRRKVIDPHEIPSTYVPARNCVFLSFAASYAEAVEAGAIFIGANAVDYSGYPDCRPEFLQSFQMSLNKGTKAGVRGKRIKIYAPLLRKSKAQIIRAGMKLKVPYDLTWSCYQGDKKSCGYCDSCQLRLQGFKEAGYEDPLWK